MKIFGDTKYPNFNIETYLNDLDIQVVLYDSGDHKEHAINCPVCTERGESRPDTRHRLWVNVKDGWFHCYNCKWSGSIMTFIRKLSNVDYVGAFRILRGELLDPLEHMNLKLYDESVDWHEDELKLKDVELPFGYEPLEVDHFYLTKRGIPLKYAQMNNWGLSKVGYCKNRIIVPFFMQDRLVFWQARATWEEPENKKFKKVLNPKGVSARHVLYNYDIAKNYEDVVLVEGFTDAVKVGENAMATNGKRLHHQQLEWLSKTKAKNITLIWDRDAWTDGTRKKNKKSSIKEAIDLLRIHFNVKVVKMPKKVDPGSLPYKSIAIQAVLNSAKTPESLGF